MGNPIAELSSLVEREGAEAAWRSLRLRRRELTRDPGLAMAWLWMLAEHPDAEDPVPAVLEILEAWCREPTIARAGCNRLLDLVEGRHGDDPVEAGDPAHLARDFAKRGLDALPDDELRSADAAGSLWNTYANACRLCGPAFDDDAERAYASALALRDDPWWRFNLGLFRKNRGRWKEGLEIFGVVHGAVGDEEAVLWNMGICATGAGDGAAATLAWQKLGFDARLGDDALPRVSGFGNVKVRLSTPPPVHFEHVWAEPLSPCHGRVLNPTLYDGVADCEDIVFWDGQPIGFSVHDGRRVPRFACLGRLRRGGVRTFRFAALRAARDQVQELERALPEGCSFYVFDDQVQLLCAHCIRTGGPHLAEHDTPQQDSAKRLVHGKLLLQPGVDPAQVGSALTAALAEPSAPFVAMPALYRAAGDGERAAAHVRWLEGLERGAGNSC
jgi:hypothetical protein